MIIFKISRIKSTNFSHNSTKTRLSVEKYTVADMMASTVIYTRCRPWPAKNPTAKRSTPAITQNRKSITAVTVFEPVRRRITRNTSYKNPAATPKSSAETASINC